MPQSSPEISNHHSKPKFTVTGHRFSLLFFFLLGSLILYPYAESNAFGYYVFRILASLVVLLAVYAVSFRRTLVLFALLLAIPALWQRQHIFRTDSSVLSIVNVCLSFIFDAFVVTVIFRRVFSHDKPDSQTIFGALCIYLLVGFAFTSLYGMIAILQPHAFFLNPQTNLHLTPDRLDFVYFSFGTMTSLGADGITPVSAQARSLTVIEAILGVLYLAVLIARLMGAYQRHPNSSTE